MLEYVFMQRALIAGIVVGLTVPLLGVVVVLKRLSMIGDALSHASLAGVAGGLLVGANPVLGAGVACFGAAFAVEGIRRKFARSAELAIAVVMSLGIATAAVLSGFVTNGANFNAFLFGSIVTVSDAEIVSIALVGALVALCSIAFYREFFLVSLDERAARMAGVRVAAVNFVFVLLCALTVSIASRTVGALMVSSLMVIPVAGSLKLARSYKSLVVLSALQGLASAVIGLTIAYYTDVKPGGAIVFVALGLMALSLLVARLRRGRAGA